ncbi:MAG: cation transporter [Desulfobacterales bacterium]|nr:cation transporter [Desulfobacterales bacterium]
MFIIKVIGFGIIASTLAFTAFLLTGISRLERERISSNDEDRKKICKKCADSVGMVNVIGNILMILIKAYMGIVGRSKGLVADAIHSGADLLATIVMIVGLNISDKKTDKVYPYGYGKAEYIVSIFIYLSLLFIAAYIIYEGFICIIKGHVVEICWAAFWGAFFSIFINELMFRQSVCAGNKINSPSMVAKAWESRSDVYASIAVLIGIFGAKMGFHFMDPLAAIVVGIIIIKMCIEEMWAASLNLMDKAPEESIMEDVNNALTKVENIIGINKIFAREIGQYMEFEIDVNVSSDTSVENGESIKKNIKDIVSNVLSRKTIIKVRLYAV